MGRTRSAGRRQRGAAGGTCSLWTDDGSGMHTATEFDMQLDPEWDWSAGGDTNVDLESVVAHEFGHALGLGTRRTMRR